jgi:DNA mismatch endonuclease (patch repair protein)
MRRHGLAIFVDGCFWHGCPTHGRKTPFTGPNASLWQDKMWRNRERDERSSALAAAQGLTPLRVWECEVRADAEAVARDVAARSLLAGGQTPAGPAAR